MATDTANPWRMGVLQEVYGSGASVADWAMPYAAGSLSGEDLGTVGAACKLYREQCAAQRCRPNSAVVKVLSSQAPSEVTEIVLDDNYLGPVGLLPLLSVLPLLPALRALSLRGCNLEAPQVTLVARVAAQLAKLEVLNVASNPFGCLGGKALLEAVEANQRITAVDVDNIPLVPGLRRKLSERIAANARASRP
eukprot:TRINITY_DN41064_c0_g1_i1.p1 TRINITY_DN41064_c0_g1~~TRINITY_DN41064_c0_g1_i1.p1  ORF type:complete len:221 (+),score=67.22 TRINITY_DN41064_c0_g1_i1:83-664(+)